MTNSYAPMFENKQDIAPGCIMVYFGYTNMFQYQNLWTGKMTKSCKNSDNHGHK